MYSIFQSPAKSRAPAPPPSPEEVRPAAVGQEEEEEVRHRLPHVSADRRPRAYEAS